MNYLIAWVNYQMLAIFTIVPIKYPTHPIVKKSNAAQV